MAYASNITPVGAKLSENAFQTIPIISLLDAEHAFSDLLFCLFFVGHPFLRSWKLLCATNKFSMKNTPPDEIMFRSVRHLAEEYKTELRLLVSTYDST